MARTIAEPFYRELGRRIQGLRLRRQMTQEELGQMLDPPVGRASVANLEGGKQRVLLHTFLQMVEILKCSVDDLLPPGRSPLQNDAAERKVTTELEKLNVSSRALERIRKQLAVQDPKEIK